MPSTSVTYAPLPLAMNGGVPPTAPNARTGESTPPGMERRARSNSSSDLVIPSILETPCQSPNDFEVGDRRVRRPAPEHSQLSQDSDGEHVAIGLVAGPLVVPLVVALGRIERHEVRDLGGDGRVESLPGPAPGRPGRGPLLRCV